MENLFKVLGDENRLRILNLLRENELCVCEIENILETTQSNVSRHLTRLRNLDLVVFEKRSQWTYYEMNPKFIKKNKQLYEYLTTEMNRNERFIKDLEKLKKNPNNRIECDPIKNK
ncbi:MAG: metalloregulator ArsR/SmtB family transcription factor [Atopostipes suicloacalis]|nr:metalloregulator ArsR/SmtB family transcription factor [Atopostipes suicloacalis]